MKSDIEKRSLRKAEDNVKRRSKRGQSGLRAPGYTIAGRLTSGDGGRRLRIA